MQDTGSRGLATDTYAHLLKEKISYVELIINLYIFIYIFIFLVFSLSHLFGLCVSVSLTRLFWFILIFFFSRSPFMDLYNVTKVTDLKLQSPKKRKKKEKIRESCVFCPPSLAVTAQRTLSALWWDIIKEEVVEAPCPWSSPSGWGSPEPRLKAWCPRSPWRRSQQSLAFRPRRKTSSLLALVWTAAAPCTNRLRSAALALQRLPFWPLTFRLVQPGGIRRTNTKLENLLFYLIFAFLNSVFFKGLVHPKRKFCH